jgi:hypothetical protein
LGIKRKSVRLYIKHSELNWIKGILLRLTEKRLKWDEISKENLNVDV